MRNLSFVQQHNIQTEHRSAVVLGLRRDLVFPNSPDPSSVKELFSKTKVGIYRRLKRFPCSLCMCVSALTHTVAYRLTLYTLREFGKNTKDPHCLQCGFGGKHV